MPKKRNDSARKSGVNESDDVSRDSTGDSCDSKYGNRRIRSNWERYEPENGGDECVDEKKTNDFADLITSPSDCNYFQFKSEKSWESEAAYSSFSGHKFFNLDLDVLSSGLACLPFYERVGIDKSILPQSDVERCDKKASDNISRYGTVKEKFIKKLQKDYQLPQSVHEAASKSGKDKPQSNLSDSPSMVGTVVECSQMEDKNEIVDEKIGKNTQLNMGEDKSLEKWLDSILDE